MIPKNKDTDMRVMHYHHIDQVCHILMFLIEEIHHRMRIHDKTKLSGVEKEVYQEHTYKLNGMTYGSPEYQAVMDKMSEAGKLHHKNHRHHTGHFENGINDMNLLDVLEMVIDWKAATLRYKDGDIYGSFEHNVKRFDIDPQLAGIIKNTIDWIETGKDNWKLSYHLDEETS